MSSTGPTLIAVEVGNSRTQIGQFVDGEIRVSQRLANDDLASIADRILALWKPIASTPRAAVLLASVNEPVGRPMISMMEDQLSVDIYRVGEDLPVPIGRQLDPETITGIDRLLAAAAAYDRVQQACVVVDAGTAITVDFIDGEGTFHGGAIAPGARMQLRALHEHTSALPELEFTAPNDEPFGRSTAQAMLQGVYNGIRGAVRYLVEQYAVAYEAYPLVIATGGDAELLFADDELVDRVVPDLTLLGIAAAARHAFAGDEDARRS